jgi:hypothetical protein
MRISDQISKFKYLISALIITCFSGCLSQNNPVAPAYVPPVYPAIPFPSSYVRSSVNFSIVANKTTTDLSLNYPKINKALSLLSYDEAWASASGISYEVKNSFGSTLSVNTSGFLIPAQILPSLTSFGQVSFSSLTETQINSCGGQRCTTFMVRAYFQNQSSSGLGNLTTNKFAPVFVNNIPVGLGLENAVLLQKQAIPSSATKLTETDLLIPAVYSVSADFKGLGAGDFSGNLVLEYVLYKELATTPISPPPVVNLTNFNSGGIIQGGSIKNISWTATSSDLYYRPISLDYSKDNGATWLPIAHNIPNSGSYAWTVPLVDSEVAKVRVSAVDLNGNVSISPAPNLSVPFVIDSKKPQIAITNLNNSEIFPGGGTTTVTWSAIDTHMDVNPINIYYSPDGGGTWITLASGLPNNGFHLFSVPIVDSALVQIKISTVDTAGNSNFATSGFFTIDSTSPTLTLSSFSGSEILKGGTSKNITWSAFDSNFGINPIRLEYSSDDGANWIPINTSVENTGSYSWQIPLIDSDKVRIKITATDNVGHSNVIISNRFEIDSTSPVLSLNSFNGGEYVKETTTQLIRWASSDKNLVSSPISIDLSIDGGTTWSSLASSIQNSGSFNWTVPGLNSNTCKIKITSLDSVGHSTIVYSANNFTITKGTANTIQIASGNNQTTPRSFTITTPLKVLVLDINNQAARPGLPVVFSLLSGSGSFISSTVYTDNDGYAQSYYTSGAGIESSSIKASIQKEDLTSISVQFSLQTADYSPLSVTSSLSGILESIYFSSNDLGYSATYSPQSVSSSVSPPVLGGISSVNGSSTSTTAVVPTIISTATTGTNLNSLSDIISFALNSSYPGGVSSGTCKTVSSISSLNNQPCSIGGASDFSISRSSISSGSLNFRVFSNGVGPLDYKDSSSYSLKLHSIRPISNTNSTGSDGVSAIKPIVYNSKIYFSSNNAQGFLKLFSYNINTNAIVQISNTANSNFISDNVSEMIVYNNNLFFVSELASGSKKLFKYCDGGNCGTTSLKQISDLVSSGSDGISSFSLYNNLIYFKANTNAGYVKLFKYCDFGLSCTGGIYQVADINPNATDAVSTTLATNNFLFFGAKNSSGFNKLFKYCDGNGCGAQGLSQASNIAGATQDDAVSNLTSYAGNLLFTANSPSGLNKLFRYSVNDGSITQLSNINSGSNDSPSYLTSVGADLYFIAEKTVGVQKLYRYTSSTNSLVQVSNLQNSGSDTIQEISSYNGSVLLSAKNSDGFNRMLRLNYATNKLDQITKFNSSADDNIKRMILVGTNLYFIGQVSGNYKMYRYCENGSGCVF